MSIISASTLTTTALQLTADTAGTLVFKTGATPTTALTLNADQSATFAGAVNFTTAGFTNLSITGVATFAAGTVSLPSITTAGDTNTGIYFPAADTIGFTEGGVESGRFTSAGALQLNANLNFSGTGNRITGDFSNATLTNRVFFQTSTTNGNSSLQVMPNGTANFSGFNFLNSSDTSNYGGIQIRTNSTEIGLSGFALGTGTQLPMTFAVGGSERLRIDTSGNVGIGTSSLTAKLEVKFDTTVSASNGAIGIENAGSGEQGITFTKKGYSFNGPAAAITYNGSALGVSSASYLSFRTNSGIESFPSERMRIDSSGNVGIGTSSPSGLGGKVLQVESASNYPEMIINRTGTGAGKWGALVSNSGGYLVRDYTNSLNALFIEQATGRVGINNTLPGVQLDIVGAIRSQVSGGTPILYLSNGVTQHSISNNSGVLAFQNDGTNQANITAAGVLQFNSGYGSVATAYGCRAWVNFNGSNGGVNGSGNISSVTRNGTGDYTVNFATAMPDANYCVTTAIKPASNQSSTNGKVANVRFDANLATGSCRIWCNSTAGVEDFDKIFVSIFR
jgi:hypothetical protein